ncbi:PIG-L deacetylase family protein [Sphingomonas lenta]|uniref:LmbE family protein n=1 Tax=Sphingomonas lenta TaxID=1141887 RepID=A0A2A2SFK8_9SPHN|nr:PIG-L family deacetylase [Sphingomonas lenta]PAX08046.1 LmbE family protein [Sphingomonas lenta]
MSWAARLADGAAVEEPVAVVVAHADDETLWAGSALARLRNCRLIHLTDSAPRSMIDAHRLGIERREDYARLRAAELDAALAELGATPERIAYDVPDQETADHLPALVERLTGDCRGVSAIVTHPYEGGHPDHDGAALACRIVADRLGCALVEFACYAEFDGTRVFGRFWPGTPEHARPLSPFERGAVARALAAHRSQRDVIGDYVPDAERWRDAPGYDFTGPPPPGNSLYDRFGWAITSGIWRERARALLGVPA